jgi:2-enoate reductase
MKDWGEGALPDETFIEKGRDLEEGMQIAKMLQDAGYDALDADVGCYDSWYWNHPPMYFNSGMYLPFNRELKKNVTIPVLTAGRMDDPDIALKALQEEATDFVGLARPLLADACLVNKIRKDETDDIRPCLSCQEGCIGRLKKYLHISCAVNPAACREKDFALQKTEEPKKVAIVGGGAAGCEAARVLKLRGHEPVIYEKSNRLGGKLHQAGAPEFKIDDRKLIRWYEHQIEKLDIPVEFGCKIQEEAQLEPYDTVIIATGSDPIKIPLGDDIPVVPVKDVMENPENYQEPFVIVGGGLVGCEAALMLAKQNRKVSIVEALPDLMAVNGPTCYANRQMLIDLIHFHKIPVYGNCRAKQTDATGLLIEKENAEEHVDGKTVVLSIGYRSDQTLYQKLLHSGKEVYAIGEAKDGSSNVLRSIWDAYEIAAHLS